MTNFTPEQKLTLIKHLAGGKPADVVATIMHATKDDVIGVARSHGYPDTDKLAWAADVMAKNLEERPDGINPAPLASGGQVIEGGKPRVVPSTPVTPTRDDQTLAMLNAARTHSSKRIQAAALKALEAIGKVRTLVAEDEEKNSAKRKADAEKAAARAEVERLERQLAAAKAKLRGAPVEVQARAALGSAGEFPCDGCERSFGSAHGLGVHKGRSHAEAVAS